MERAGALAGDGSKGLGVLGLHEAGAGPKRHALGHEQGGQPGIAAQVGRRLRHAVREIGRRHESALGEPDGGGGHVLDRQRSECAQSVAPARERAGHRDRERAHLVGAPDGFPVARQLVGHRLVHRAVGGARRGAQAVDHYVAAAGQADMGDTPAQYPHHHRLHHGEGEQGCDRGVDGVSAGEQHLRARSRCERVIGDDHGPRAAGRPLLTGEGGETPRCQCHSSSGVHRATPTKSRSVESMTSSRLMHSQASRASMVPIGNAAAATGIAQVRRLHMIGARRGDEGKRGEALDDHRRDPGSAKSLKQLLQDQPGREHLLSRVSASPSRATVGWSGGASRLSARDHTLVSTSSFTTESARSCSRSRRSIPTVRTARGALSALCAR